MIVKLMSAEDLPDDDPRKAFRMFEGVEAFQFYRTEDGADPEIEMFTREGSEITADVVGNGYVMNDFGDLLTSFSPNAFAGDSAATPTPEAKSVH